MLSADIKKIKQDDYRLMKDFGFTPKEALIYWAINPNLYPKNNPSMSQDLIPFLADTQTAKAAIATGILDQRGNYRFWNSIDPTGYLNTDPSKKKYNYSKYFIGKLNQKLQKIAMRIASKPGRKRDIASGIRLDRIGSDLEALQNAIASGDVTTIVTATKALAQNKDFKDAGLSILAMLPPDKIQAYASAYGGDVLKKYNVDIGEAIKDPVGYAKKKGMEIAVNKGKEELSSFISSLSQSSETTPGNEAPREEDKGFFEGILNGYQESQLSCYSCYSGLGASTSSTYYRLTPDEEKIANRIYENTYRLFQPVWQLKNNPEAFWPAFWAAVDKADFTFPTPADAITSFYDARDYATDLPRVSKSNLEGLTPLIRAFAISSLLTSKDRFALSDRILHFKSDAIARIGRAASKPSNVKIKYDEISLDRVDPNEYQEVDAAALLSKLKPQSVFSLPKQSFVKSNKISATQSNAIPITLGVIAAGGLAYWLYFSSQGKRNKVLY